VAMSVRTFPKPRDLGVGAWPLNGIDAGIANALPKEINHGKKSEAVQP
jgi:hypothetical protein